MVSVAIVFCFYNIKATIDTNRPDCVPGKKIFFLTKTGIRLYFCWRGNNDAPPVTFPGQRMPILL